MKRFIADDVLNMLGAKAKAVRDFHSTCSYAQQEYTRMISRRDALIETIGKVDLKEKSACPLCGHEYADAEAMMSEIRKQGDVLKQISGRLGNQLTVLFNDLKTYYVNNVLNPVLSTIKAEGLSQDVINAVEDAGISRFVKFIESKAGVTFDAKGSAAETRENCRVLLASMINTYDPEIDYARLDLFYGEYMKVLIPENLTVPHIEMKRSYIMAKWKERSSEQIRDLSGKYNRYRRIEDNCKAKSQKLGQMMKRIKDQKNDYIAKLISDIEILFYIYSGRIMQDNYYGRGVLMKWDQKRVLFVSGNYSCDIDVLYNMSSGQLTVVQRKTGVC